MHTPDPRPRIAELRKAAGLTQLQLSQRVGVTETTIANWERGRGGLDWIVKLIRLCDALGCDLKDLIENPATAAAPLLSLEEAQALMKPPLPSQNLSAQSTADIEAIAPVSPPQPADPPLSLSDAQRLMSSSVAECASASSSQPPHSVSREP